MISKKLLAPSKYVPGITQDVAKAAVHAMHQVFESLDADGVLLVDASNAFNCLNRQTALLNIKKLCPTHQHLQRERSALY